MNMPTVRYLAVQIIGVGFAVAVAALLGCAVGFVAQLLYGRDVVATLYFVLFMFAWIFFPCWLAASVFVVFRIQNRAKAAGVDLNYLGKLSKSERIEFQKKHHI